MLAALVWSGASSQLGAGLGSRGGLSERWQPHGGGSGRARRLQQARPQDEQQQQEQQEQEDSAAGESVAGDSLAEGSAMQQQAQSSGEDAAQQAEDSGLPVMSGGTRHAECLLLSIRRFHPGWHTAAAAAGNAFQLHTQWHSALVPDTMPTLHNAGAAEDTAAAEAARQHSAV